MKKFTYLLIILAAFPFAFAIQFIVKRNALKSQYQKPVITSQKEISVSCGMPPEEDAGLRMITILKTVLFIGYT